MGGYVEIGIQEGDAFDEDCCFGRNCCEELCCDEELQFEEKKWLGKELFLFAEGFKRMEEILLANVGSKHW